MEKRNHFVPYSENGTSIIKHSILFLHSPHSSCPYPHHSIYLSSHPSHPCRFRFSFLFIRCSFYLRLRFIILISCFTGVDGYSEISSHLSPLSPPSLFVHILCE